MGNQFLILPLWKWFGNHTTFSVYSQNVEWCFLCIEQKHQFKQIFVDTFNCFDILFFLGRFAFFLSIVTILSNVSLTLLEYYTITQSKHLLMKYSLALPFSRFQNLWLVLKSVLFSITTTQPCGVTNFSVELWWTPKPWWRNFFNLRITMSINSKFASLVRQFCLALSWSQSISAFPFPNWAGSPYFPCITKWRLLWADLDPRPGEFGSTASG